MFCIYDTLSKQYAVKINDAYRLTPNAADAEQWYLAAVAQEYIELYYPAPTYEAVVLPWPPPVPPTPAPVTP